MKVNFVIFSILAFIFVLSSTSKVFGGQQVSPLKNMTAVDDKTKSIQEKPAKNQIDKSLQDSDEKINPIRQQQLIHLVKQDCGSCHGMTLQGGLGPALTKEALQDKPFLLIKNTILFGRPGTAMPPWQNILTEHEASWISEQLVQGLNDDK